MAVPQLDRRRRPRRPFPAALHVRVHPPESVTSTSPNEIDPTEVGLQRDDVEAMWRSVVRLYRTGLHPALSLCVRRRGRIVLERAIGHLRGNAPDDAPDAPLTPARHDSLFCLFSASKSVAAMIIHMLDDRGLIHLDDAVVEYIPEFGKHGKHGITVRQLLTHRAGIPTVAGHDADLDTLLDPEKVLQVIYDARPMSVPGRRLAYHALTGGFVFAEIVKRVTGRDIRTFMRDEILRPLRFSTFNFGIERARVAEVAEHAFTGLPAMQPLAWFVKRALGVGPREAVDVSNDPRYITSVIPSGNIIGTAEEASRFYQLLLQEGELDGKRVFDRRTVRRAVAETSYLELDSFLALPVRYGMGFILGSERFSIYGPGTPHAFGHVGFTNVVAWADPERELAVGLMTTGKPFATPGQLVWLDVMRTISRRTPRDRRRPHP